MGIYRSQRNVTIKMLKKGLKLILGSTALGGATGYGYTRYQNSALEDDSKSQIQNKAIEQSKSK